MSTVPLRMAAPATQVSRSRKNPPVFPPLPGDLTSGVSLVEGVARIPYQEAYRVLAEALAPDAEKYAPALREELPAIVTHWLQSTTEAPIMLGAAEGARWRQILSGYAAAARDAAQPVPFIIDYSSLPFAPVANPSFQFIDLFAGIGGFRLALQAQGGKCVFTSEWDKHAKHTYALNFGETPFGDIRQFTGPNITEAEIKSLIPDHDILAAGFPCQPFSNAGVSARSSLGQSHGFSCEIQGTLFFDLVRIAKAKRPRVLLLENVRNLENHNKGDTFKRIRHTIENDLGYSFDYQIIDSSPLVPQKRKRCYMVCIRDKGAKFQFPEIIGPSLALGDFLEEAPAKKYTISDRLWLGHKNRTQRNLDRGAGFTAFEADLSKPAHTLVARYYKDGKECLIPQKGQNPRMLTPKECARLQGYPAHFNSHPTDTHAYKQFGNSVAVPVVELVASSVVNQVLPGIQ
jgi:DNA (cytosine-5)-methyltransferase 1